MQGMHAGGAGALDIAQAVVDEHRRFGFHAIARVEQLEDLAVDCRLSALALPVAASHSYARSCLRGSIMAIMVFMAILAFH